MDSGPLRTDELFTTNDPFYEGTSKKRKLIHPPLRTDFVLCDPFEATASFIPCHSPPRIVLYMRPCDFGTPPIMLSPIFQIEYIPLKHVFTTKVGENYSNIIHIICHFHTFHTH